MTAPHYVVYPPMTMDSDLHGDEPSTNDSFVPVRRTTGLLESQVGDELVLYDVEDDRAHALNASALSLWRACDGTADVAALAGRLALDPELIWHGLRELDRQGLFISTLPAGTGDRRIGRREMLKKVAVGSAIGLAVPTILSVIAADPAAAATCKTAGQACTGGQNNCIGAAQGNCCAGLKCCNSPRTCLPGP